MGEALFKLPPFSQLLPRPRRTSWRGGGRGRCGLLGGGSGGLGHGFEGLQYEVGLVDEPVCADEDVYCLSVFEVCFEGVAETFGVFHKLLFLMLQGSAILVLIFFNDIIDCVQELFNGAGYVFDSL